MSFNQGAYPKVNVYEHDEKITILAEIPGLDKSNVQVDVEEQVLTIKGDKHGLTFGDGKCITRELKQSAFTRSFNLGEHLDGGNVSAKFKDGMLSISVPSLIFLLILTHCMCPQYLFLDRPWVIYMSKVCQLKLKGEKQNYILSSPY